MKEDATFGFHKSTTYHLRLEYRLRRSWRYVRNEAHSKHNVDIRVEQHLQFGKCMVFRLWRVQLDDVSWRLVSRVAKARTTQLCGNWGWHNSPHSTCRQCPIQERWRINLHKKCFACTHHNIESLCRPDRGTRHVSLFQPWKMLHWEGRLSHLSWPKRRPNVYPRVKRGKLNLHKADTDIELWHKRIDHINLQKLKDMPTKGVVIGLLTFTEKEIVGVCEVCQNSANNIGKGESMRMKTLL